MRHAVAALLAVLFLIPSVCPGQTVLNEQAGDVTISERVLLRLLDKHGIPTPDSIVVVEDTSGVLYGYVKPFTLPRTVHLTPTRLGHPDADTLGGFPYLYGRKTTTYSETPPQTHVLAHEIGHILGPILNAEMGRPALGVHTSTDEVQAEIIGLVLGNLAFDWTPDQLGFPTRIDYPFVQDKTVKALQRQYCYIIKKTWSVEALSCGYGL
jgi:hypothetical protein